MTDLLTALTSVGWSPAEAAGLLEGKLPPFVDVTVVDEPDEVALMTMASDAAAWLGFDPYKIAQLGLALVAVSSVVLYRLPGEFTETADELYGIADRLATVLDAATIVEGIER